MKLLISTNNLHKLQEYRALLEELPLSLTCLRDEGISTTVEEDGLTFEENAVTKARTYASLSGLLTLADDSGLEVDALGGEPGVFSARYAGPEATDRERVAYLLAKMQGIPWEKRRACFRCVIAIADPTSNLWVCEGRCEGFVALEPRGDRGFGYDPIFYLPDMALTMAELAPSKKNQISHRAQAAHEARKVLLELVSSK
ncbi:MAG: RdgB/HAM1 family non-canonical purine NTP pyrophosphatase [Dehalococcoidia bacterium]|nr:RdgB/HAM1 family non-canonical purine NTP pyrophosphatase [Dehalococcoidia bacterium]